MLFYLRDRHLTREDTMRCEECQGAGYHFHKQLGSNDNAVSYAVMHIKVYPCPSCNGSGITSCCDAAGSARLHEYCNDDDKN